MTRFAARLFHIFVSAVLLTSFFVPVVHADGPALTAKFGIAGRYRPGGWCLVTVSVRNPGTDTISGQIQVLTSGEPNRSPYGRQARTNAPSVVFAAPVTISGGNPNPQSFPVYLRGIDPSQADLSVRLVEGRERGDGRVLAEINNQNPNLAAAFTGSPISANDTLFVGFGGDPGAFLFLNGRRLSAARSNTNFPSPLVPNQYGRGGPAFNVPTTPATVQIAEAASASELPDKAAGYGGVNTFLLRSDAPIEALTEAQSAALKGWVASGGHLVVCGGSDPTRFGAAFFEGLLPAAVSGSNASGQLVLTPKPLPGVQTLATAANGTPSSVTGPYGAGSVTLAAYDPTTSAFQAASAFALPSLWHRLLSSPRDPTASVLGMTAAREENDAGAVYYGSGQPLLSEAVMRGPSLDAPGTGVIGAFLLVYLIVLVPVNYLVLKRYDRKEWAWLTIPALVFIFAAGTFGVGYAAKGGSVFVNRAALIETGAGQREAGVYSEIGLFSPHRTSYDIALTGTNMSAAIPNPGLYYGRQGGGDTQFSGAAQFVQTPTGVSLVQTPVNMWAMRAFDTQSTVDLGGTVDGAVSATNGLVSGTVTNRTPNSLTECGVWYQGRWFSLGTLAPGASGVVSVAAPGSSSFANGPFLVPYQSGRGGENGSVSDKMHTALAGYFRSLSQNSPNYYGGTPLLPTYSPAPNEALFVGWSNDAALAGPAPRIDGRAVTENDVSLLIVHIPAVVK